MGQLDLDPEAWALLGFIHRYTHGGPPAPSSSTSFGDAYATLASNRLIEHAGERGWDITDGGESALRVRYADDRASGSQGG